MDDDAEVMNQSGAMSQQEEQQATAAALAAADDDYGYPSLQRYDRVRFWKTCRSPHQCDDDEGTLGVVLELDDDNYIGIKSDDGVQDFIQRANIELVMPAALWIREAFKRWCQQEVSNSSDLFFRVEDSFTFQGVDYENIPLDDAMACELEKALRHNETFTEVRIATIESPMLLQQVNRDRLNNLVRALLYLPKLRALCLRNMSDQDVVNAVFSNLGVAGQLICLQIDQSLLPSIQFSQDLQDVKVKKAMLVLDTPVITSVESSRNFIAQVVASKCFWRVCLDGCSADFVCLFLQEMATNKSNIKHLDIQQMHTPATAVVNSETTGTMSLFLEALRSFLISSAENNLEPLYLLMWNNNINYRHFVDAILLHDNICYLDISGETVDDEVANAIGHLLRTTKKLRALELPRHSNHSWTCSEKRQLEIINSIAMNQSLHELSIGGIPVGILFGALCQNHSLEKLIFDGSPGDQAGPDGLEALKSFTTLRVLRIDGIRLNIESVRAALRMNTSLERVEMGVGANEVGCTNDDHVCTYLARNRWFHQNEALLLQNPGHITAALWSHVLARVSSNPTFLFKLVQSNPDTFLECRFFQKRPRSYMPA